MKGNVGDSTGETSHAAGPGRDPSGDFVVMLIGLQPDLKGFVAHLMPYPDVREDIIQEVNLLVWAKRNQFKQGTNFRAWVFAFARNVTMKFQRRARRENKLAFSTQTMDLLMADFLDDDPRVDERMPALRRCLEKVPEDERDLLLRHYEIRGTVARAANAAGRSAAALRAMLYRLRISLRACVEKEMNHAINPSP